MENVRYNARQAETGAIPIGVFDSVIVDAEHTYSKSGNSMLKMRLNVGDQYARVPVYMLTTPANMPEVKEFLLAVGGYDTSKDFEFGAGELVGKFVKIETREDGEFNGRKRVRVARWIEVDDAAEVKVDIPKPPAGPTAVAGETESDEVPF